MNAKIGEIVVVIAVLAAVVAAVLVWRGRSENRMPTDEELEREFEQMPPHDSELGEMKDMKIQFGKTPAADAKKKRALTDAEAAEARPKTEAEKAEEAAEKLVNDFDALTDRWMSGVTKEAPTMKDVDEFAERFRKLPDDRKDECIHRALNLIPDENVMLLAGVLMDKTQDKAIVKTVYNDVLNRSETVKKPILEQIFKDKTHPCWSDTAWIFDVTGKVPSSNQQEQE